MRKESSTAAADEALAMQVKLALRQDVDTGGLPIDVQAENGVITLRGRVDRPEQREEAEQLARRTLSVREVINQLRVSETEEA
jgi:osmotically-inducible protein OsmY